MAGQIQITAATHKAVCHAFECVPRGSLPVKGKGEMAAWWVTGPKLPQVPSLSNREESCHAYADQTLYAVGA
jgi:hypothetical protein